MNYAIKLRTGELIQLQSLEEVAKELDEGWPGETGEVCQVTFKPLDRKSADGFMVKRGDRFFAPEREELFRVWTRPLSVRDLERLAKIRTRV